MNDDYDDEQTDICYNQAVMEWWYGCWGDECGTNLPEGICYEKCTPDLIEEVTKCDGMLINITVYNLKKWEVNDPRLFADTILY